ncbi:uncharacterized protein LOC107845551 [Capsicum annuum]|uniref:uncharacterized protein LOC107845551 n=1 Tax=Capsicum annuum TaxID=4072 RepID=UPI001FB10C3F|nr:uncharacterized protein LOC107845551 [Capsicum annuum]
MDLLAKNLLLGKTEMVKAVESQGTVSTGADVENFYDKPDYKDREKGHWRNNNDRSGSYVTPESRDVVATSSVGAADEPTFCYTKPEKNWSGKMLFGPFVGKFVENKKKVDDANFGKFMAMLKQLTISFPLVEALEQVPGYAKFMKDLIIKKRKVSNEQVDNIHYCSTVSTRFLVQKKADPGTFTIPCKVGSKDIAKALCDLGASMNLMPLAICKKLGLEDPTPTNMRLVMADRLIKQTVGILHKMLVQVANFILPADFVVLDYDVDFEVPIILGRPFLATGRVIVDIELNELKFRLGKKEAKFKLHQPMSQQNDINVFSIIDVFYEDEKGGSIGRLGKV